MATPCSVSVVSVVRVSGGRGSPARTAWPRSRTAGSTAAARIKPRGRRMVDGFMPSPSLDHSDVRDGSAPGHAGHAADVEHLARHGCARLEDLLAEEVGHVSEGRVLG